MLTLSQTSVWNSWRHDIKDACGNLLGEIHAPLWAQATNSRLGVVSQADSVAAQMKLSNGQFLIRFEHLKRGWVNDVAWWLESPEGDVLARIERICPPSAAALPHHLLRVPAEGELRVVSARRLRPFDVRLFLSDGQQALRITTPAWLSLKLCAQAEGDFGSIPQRVFLIYYALHLR